MYLHIDLLMHLCLYLYMCMYTRIWILVYIHIDEIYMFTFITVKYLNNETE